MAGGAGRESADARFVRAYHELRRKKEIRVAEDPACRDVPLRGKLNFTLALIWITSSFMFAETILEGGIAPMSENPMMGPSIPTLLSLGGLETSLMQSGQLWRVFSNMVLHAGFIHLAMNILLWFQLGLIIEPDWGFWRTGLVFTLAGVTGSLMTASLDPYSVTVGASGGIFGIMAAFVPYVMEYWHSIPQPKVVLAISAISVVFGIALGFVPFVDNYAHMGGAIGGLLGGFLTLTKLEILEDKPPRESHATRRRAFSQLGLSSVVQHQAIALDVGASPPAQRQGIEHASGVSDLAREELESASETLDESTANEHKILKSVPRPALGDAADQVEIPQPAPIHIDEEMQHKLQRTLLAAPNHAAALAAALQARREQLAANVPPEIKPPNRQMPERNAEENAFQRELFAAMRARRNRCVVEEPTVQAEPPNDIRSTVLSSNLSNEAASDADLTDCSALCDDYDNFGDVTPIEAKVKDEQIEMGQFPILTSVRHHGAVNAASSSPTARRPSLAQSLLGTAPKSADERLGFARRTSRLSFRQTRRQHVNDDFQWKGGWLWTVRASSLVLLCVVWGVLGGLVMCRPAWFDPPGQVVNSAKHRSLTAEIKLLEEEDEPLPPEALDDSAPQRKMLMSFDSDFSQVNIKGLKLKI